MSENTKKFASSSSPFSFPGKASLGLRGLFVPANCTEAPSSPDSFTSGGIGGLDAPPNTPNGAEAPIDASSGSEGTADLNSLIDRPLTTPPQKKTGLLVAAGNDGFIYPDSPSENPRATFDSLFCPPGSSPNVSPQAGQRPTVHRRMSSLPQSMTGRLENINVSGTAVSPSSLLDSFRHADGRVSLTSLTCKGPNQTWTETEVRELTEVVSFSRLRVLDLEYDGPEVAKLNTGQSQKTMSCGYEDAEPQGKESDRKLSPRRKKSFPAQGMMQLSLLLCLCFLPLTKAFLFLYRGSSSSNALVATSQLATTDVIASDDTTIWSRDQLEDFADRQGVVLSLTTLGPLYRAVARPKHNQTLILGYVEGFVRPTGNLLHVDKMEVFRKIVKQSRKENPDEFKGGGTNLGVGLLMGFLCMLHGKEAGCRDAEFLAIDDEDRQHKRLVKYYRAAGFDFIKYVGDSPRDIPDRLVWGGCGTLLRKDIASLLAYWTKLMLRSDQTANEE
jgi:hypothetical protein